MSDYTIIQLAKLEKYKTEFIDYMESVIVMAKGFKKEIESKFDSLTPEEQERNREEYLRRLKFFDTKIAKLEAILSSYRRIISSIKGLSRRTEESIRVHTAINVVKEQFSDKNIPREIKKAYNSDVQKKAQESYGLEGIYSDIERLRALLKEQGLEKDYVGNKTITNLVTTLERIAEEINRTHSVDDKLKVSIEPKASITTEEKMRILDEYERRVKLGEMNRIQTLNTRVLFAGPKFTPSRVMITGEKSRAALVRISTIEKQIEAVNTAIGIIAKGRGYMGFDNTYLLLTTLRYTLEESLRKQIAGFKDDELDLISSAIGKTDSRIVEYAEMYADLETVLKNDPNNLDKIAMLRVRLLQYSDSKKMTSEEIYEAIKIARNINKDREAAKGNIHFKIDLDRQISQGLSKHSTLEDKVLSKLKAQGVIREDATVYSLTAKERLILDKQMRLEEEVENALEKFRVQKLAFDRSAVVYRQGKFYRKPNKR